MTDLLNAILPNLLEFVLVIAIPWVLAQATKFVEARAEVAEDARVQAALEVVRDITEIHLVQINKEIVEQLKAANADGELTQAEIQAIKAHAIRRIWETIPSTARDLLLKVLPGGEEGFIGNLISPLIEFALSRLKAGGLVPTTEELREEAPAINLTEAAKARARIGLL